MGKSRRNRARGGNRSDPLSRPAKPPSDPELAALREEKILPVLKELQGTDAKARSMAAGAISNIIDDDKCRRLLLREGLIRILMEETLTDSSPDGKATGWEIIKTVAEKEDSGFCIHLYRQDILSAIEFAAKTVSPRATHLVGRGTYAKLPSSSPKPSSPPTSRSKGQPPPSSPSFGASPSPSAPSSAPWARPKTTFSKP